MTVGNAHGTRRWRSAIAVAAVLGLFCAVTAGWASHGRAVAGLERAASPRAVHAAVNAAPVQAHNACPGAPNFSAGSAPTHHKSTKTPWMTQDRPPTWARSSPPSIGSPLPASFEAAIFRLPRAPSRMPEMIPPDGDLLTRLRVARC
ncbi:hypothetical protein [Mycobacterium scrofulaceum]|uniref:Uncharacterized protein n=1 Tax=Mycobacterium scrofulaceum TaxID=1783 RepID=A0A1X0KF20_MYCSC|nr:hypothetical protein [Mycobacterium scrofulaceum]ORB73784.1 hypothetical protein BST44_12765 [Mycobacterium scrofulaceum]